MLAPKTALAIIIEEALAAARASFSAQGDAELLESLERGRRQTGYPGAMREAAERAGFFYVRNHGIGRELIARTEAIARRFFAQPLALKQSVAPGTHSTSPAPLPLRRRASTKR